MRVCACPPAPRPSRYTLHDAVLLSCAIIYWHAAARYEVRPGVYVVLSSPNAYHCHKITIATALPATHTMRRHLMCIRNAQRLHSLASLPHSHARCFDHPLIMPVHLFAFPSSRSLPRSLPRSRFPLLLSLARYYSLATSSWGASGVSACFSPPRRWRSPRECPSSGITPRLCTSALPAPSRSGAASSLSRRSSDFSPGRSLPPCCRPRTFSSSPGSSMRAPWGAAIVSRSCGRAGGSPTRRRLRRSMRCGR